MKGCEEEGCRGGGIHTPLMSPKTHVWTPCDDGGGMLRASTQPQQGRKRRMRKAARCKGGHRAGGFHPLLEISPCPQLSRGAACDAVKALGAVGGCYPAVKHLYNLTTSGSGVRILLSNKEISQNRLQVSKKCWFVGLWGTQQEAPAPQCLWLWL